MTPMAHERSIPFISHLLIVPVVSQKDFTDLLFSSFPNSMAALMTDRLIPRSDILFLACLLRVALPLQSLRAMRRDESLSKILLRRTVSIISLLESRLVGDVVLSLLFSITLFKWGPKPRFSKST